MQVGELNIEKRFVKIFKSDGISELYPPQSQAVECGLLAGESIILCTPTASGKTFTAELSIAKALEQKRKVVYIVPLRALAFEKYSEFKKYEELGFKVRLEVGDMDSRKYKRRLDFDILVATAEKCDSILRGKPDAFSDVSLLVMDEIHMIATSRGPVYEILVAKLRKMFSQIQILGLSATIGNAKELADWLDAALVDSAWRPVPLTEDVIVSAGFEGLRNEVKATLGKGGQVMVFVNSRKSAESVSEKLGIALKLRENSDRLKGISKKILSALSSSTTQCRRLSRCVETGTAFHHAGLVNAQRVIIEDAFKAGDIKVIVATPTLAAGVNLPSRTVILRDVKRYGIDGMHYIPVLEYKQQVGRAGRPKFDSVGRALTLAKSESEQEYIIEHYVNGSPESIHSQLGVEPTLRFHTLASIASNYTRTFDALSEFFTSTFFGFQYGFQSDFKDMLDNIIKNLIEWGLILKNGRFLIPTELGVRVSELYIDPKTVYNYINMLEKSELAQKFTSISLFEILADAVEMPHLRVKSSEESALWSQAYDIEDQMLRDLGSFELDWMFLNRFKTACMFEDWVDEGSEDHLLEKYNVAPGQLYQRIQIMQWLVYSAIEIARITGLKGSVVELTKLGVRVQYGIKDELTPLVSVRGIGRIRARKMFDRGIKNVSDIKRVDKIVLKELLGRKVAEKIIQEI